MEYMSLATLIGYGTPILLLALIILNVYQSTVIYQLRKELSNLKESITWGNTCDERHKRIDQRLDKLEEKVFNGM